VLFDFGLISTDLWSWYWRILDPC